MIDLVIGTKNSNKVSEIKKILDGLPLRVLSLKDGKWDVPDVVEDGETFSDNAIKKVKAIYDITNTLTMADDSGIMVDVLDGKPGVYSARFSGETATDKENNDKLMKLMKDVPLDKRGAQFVCLIAIIGKDNNIKTVEGICRGKIAFTEKGDSGFGYDPLFIPDGYNETFAELGMEIKNKISHRSRALNKLKEVIGEYL